MKKIIVFSSLLIIATATFSQQTKTSTTLTQPDYLKKSKHQKKTGLILLLGGTASVLVIPLGVLVITKSWTASSIPFVAGLIAIPASIPFFIAASRNKKKAMSLSFKNEIMPKNGSFTSRPFTALALRISL